MATHWRDSAKTWHSLIIGAVYAGPIPSSAIRGYLHIVVKESMKTNAPETDRILLDPYMIAPVRAKRKRCMPTADTLTPELRKTGGRIGNIDSERGLGREARQED